MKRITVILTTPPYGESHSHDGLDFAVAGTNFGHHIAVLFEGDGVWQLKANQQPPKGIKHVLKRITALPFFDIEDLFVCEQSMLSRMSDEALPEEVRSVTAKEKVALLTDSDMVVRF